MGGPWRARGFDPAAWRPPAPQVQGEQASGSGWHDYLVGIVIGYVASVVTSIAIVLTFLKGG